MEIVLAIKWLWNKTWCT